MTFLSVEHSREIELLKLNKSPVSVLGSAMLSVYDTRETLSYTIEIPSIIAEYKLR